MYPISDELKKLFLDGNKKCVKLTLNGVSFENDVITEADVLSDSLTVDRYCSSGNKIEVGSAIAAELTLTLVNNNEKFGDKIFEGADVALEIGIEGVADSFIPCGKFTVDEPPRSSFHIKLKALDYMMRFDKRVDLTKLSFPMSVEALLDRICEICEVEISSDINLASLPNMDQTVMNAPASGDLTYRQILQWIAQITGTCAFMDWNGKLCLSWFTDTGMTLTPSLRYVGGNIDENDITISGVTVGTETKGSADYALIIEGNQLIYPGTEEVLAENIYNAIKGLTYRPFACNCIPMPFLYPLDIVSYEELNGNIIQTVITNHNFGLNKVSALSAIGETATKNNYSSRRGITKQEIDAAISEALKGIDSKAEHIYIKYSPYDGGYDEGGNLVWSDTPTADTVYLGTCATNNATAPDTPSSYKWVKIRGADGINGKGISEVINYYLTTNKADGVTRDDFGGNTEIVTPDKDKPYLWNYEEIRYTSGNPTYTDPCIIGNFAENGSNGRGIKSITEYYLTTQTESTPSKTSFKGVIQTPSLTYPFLWNYEKIEYTDDSTPYESDVRLIGVYGSDGKSLFTWVKYADDASGTNMSDDATGKKYMGIAYNKTSATESTTASDYAWSKIQGDNGRGVSKVETEYRLSTSDTSLSSGYTWGTDAPTWQDGLFLWTRLATTYTDGTTEYSDPVVDASWKKTSVVDEATEELNSALAGALGLHKTELDGTIYYHTNSVLQNSTSLDVIFVLNSSGFGVCKSGWSNENLTFSYGVTTTGQAVWDIITAHKISADLVETGSIRSLPSAKVQTTINLDDGTYTSTAGDTKITIYGGEFDEESGAEIKPAGISIENISDGSAVWFSASGIQFMSQEYLEAHAKYVTALALDIVLGTNNAPALKPADPYFSGIAEKDIKTTNIHCKNIYLFDTDSGTEYNLLDKLVIMGEQVNLLSESLAALQEKYLALEETLGQQHEHTASTAVRENVVNATCTSQGSYDEVVYCSSCGEELSRTKKYTSVISHSYTSSITKQPTCIETGIRTYTCTRCSDSYTEVISATGEHIDSDGNGYCDVCGTKTGEFYTLTLNVEPSGSGTVEGAGSYLSGSTATVKATPASGYKFIGWYYGDSKWSSNTVYSFNVTFSRTLTAKFEVEELTITEGVETAVVVSTAKEIVYLKFIPQNSGTYTFESLDQASLDPDGYVYDENKAQLSYSTTTGAFSLTYDFLAGTTYYLGVRLWSGTGTVKVKVSYNAEVTTPTYAEDTIADGVLYIGTNTTSIDNTYQGNTEITKVIIPNNVTEFATDGSDTGGQCFRGCTNLTEVVVGSGITKITYACFYDCSRLAKVTIPTSVTTISEFAFGETALTDVYYKGTQEQWSSINIENNNTPLTNATIHYNS